MNNVGSNGYVWSSSLNTSNPNNAHNLNFNSNNLVTWGNNNRYYGQSVRGVVLASALTLLFTYKILIMFCLTKKRLLLDLYIAYNDAKRHKSNRNYVKDFEKDLHNNLLDLCSELYSRTYQAQPSTCFIITYPKKREVFAANFRDRIVHHLYFNYTHILFEQTFIQDSYSCIKNRGTHYGVNRLEKNIKKCSNNYNISSYTLKMDIQGYFMSIDREILLKIVNHTLDKMKHHKYNNNLWGNILDFDFIKYLSKEIILLDPTQNCIFKSHKKDWFGLPKSKSLFTTKKNCGLPIGNLTSQLFSNVYLNTLDQFVKRTLKCKYYGRYVDDFYIVHTNKKELHQYIKKIDCFLKEKLHLNVQQGKTVIINNKYGVEFLGAFIKPYRKYISNHSFKRIKKNISNLECNRNMEYLFASINSYLGILKHYKSFNIILDLLLKHHFILKKGYFNNNLTKYQLYKNT